MQLIGLNWPDVDEDKVREFGDHVKTFADNMSGTHDAASSTDREMGSHYSGALLRAVGRDLGADVR